jgi:hypothetical protein
LNLKTHEQDLSINVAGSLTSKANEVVLTAAPGAEQPCTVAEDPDIIKKLEWCSEEANRALATSNDQAQGAVEYARKCGEYLNRAKALLPHGGFQKWLEQNFKGSARTARDYRRLASNWQSIADSPMESIAGAIALIRLGDSTLEEMIPQVADDENGTSVELAETDMPGKGAPRQRSKFRGSNSSAAMVSGDGSAQTNPSAESSLAPGDKAATVIVLLRKHLKAGPTKAVREELRKVQEFCRQELSKFGSSIDSGPEDPPVPGSV